MMKNSTSECCKRLLVPRTYYLVLIGALVLCSASLARRSAPWGVMTKGSPEYRDIIGRRYTWELWLNPLSAEGCSTFLSGQYYFVTDSNLNNLNFHTVDAKDTVQCFEQSYDQWKTFYPSATESKFLDACRSSGLASFSLMIASMFFALISLVMVRCFYDNCDVWVHYVILFISLACLLTAVSTYYTVCVGTTPAGWLGADGRQRVVALGYIYAVFGTIFMLSWMALQAYVLYIRPDKFFYDRDVVDDSAFAEARLAATQNSNNRNSNARNSTISDEVNGTNNSGFGDTMPSGMSSDDVKPTQTTTNEYDDTVNPFDEMAYGSGQQKSAYGGQGGAY